MGIFIYAASLMLEYSAVIALRIYEPHLPRPFRIQLPIGGLCVFFSPPMGLCVFVISQADLMTLVAVGGALGKSLALA